MINLVPISPDHHEELYRIFIENEPFGVQLLPSLSHFVTRMIEMDGFTMMNDDQIIGAVTFSHYIPYVDIMINMVVDRKFRGRWANRRILKQISMYVYDDLGLQRMSSYSIDGVTKIAKLTLERLGFKLEGIREMGCLLPDGYHDVYLYGLLRSRCRWL